MLAKEIIDKMLGISLHPALKARGFRKSGRRFSRRHGSTQQTIWLELSSWNRGTEGSFSVWVSIKFDEMGADNPHPDFFSRIDGVTGLAPPAFDVNASIPLEHAAQRLNEIIVEGVVTPLDAVKSLADFESLGWADAMPWGFAARMAYHLGKDAEAASLIAREAAFFSDRGVTEDGLVERYRLYRLRR